MATWTVTAQLNSGTTTLTVNATDRVWFNGTNFGDNVVVGAYQDSTHISDNADAHIAACTTNTHVKNTKYLTSTTMSLSGAGSANLSTLTTANAPLKINFSDAASVVTSAAKFYAYDGTTDSTAPVGVTVQAAEASITSTWVAASPLAGALTIADDTTSTSHDYFIGVSVSPTATGAKTGKFKLTLTYV